MRYRKSAWRSGAYQARAGRHRTPATATPLFVATGRRSSPHCLPIQLFRDLLDAFAQDVVKKRYADYPELLDYCRRSANPVGRLVLHLFGRTASPDNLINPTASAAACN
jgi:phytoene/squalene synthetase